MNNHQQYKISKTECTICLWSSTSLPVHSGTEELCCSAYFSRIITKTSQTTRKTNKWVIEQIKSEHSIEVKITKLRQLHFGHIMVRQCSMENTIMLQKVDSSKRGRPNRTFTQFKGHNSL